MKSAWCVAVFLFATLPANADKQNPPPTFDQHRQCWIIPGTDECFVNPFLILLGLNPNLAAAFDAIHGKYVPEPPKPKRHD